MHWEKNSIPSRDGMSRLQILPKNFLLVKIPNH